MTVPDSLSEHSHDALRADIRRLSTMLGQTIALHGGPDLLELVEQVRKESRVAIASGDDAAISALLTGLDSGTAVWLARAFSQFFQLANIAEQRHRAAELAGRAPLHGIVQRLASADPDEVNAVLARLELRPVFTAHPTEASRQSVLAILRRVAVALDEGVDDDRLGAYVDQLWQTDELRPDKPTVADEARAVGWYMEQLGRGAVPDLLGELDREVRAAGFTLPEDARPLVLGCWVGGDRDGNPNVTPAVTREVLELYTDRALRIHESLLEQLLSELSISTRVVGVSEELRASLAHDRRLLPDVYAKRNRLNAHEPYRLKLSFIQARLANTRTRIATGARHRARRRLPRPARLRRRPRRDGPLPARPPRRAHRRRRARPRPPHGPRARPAPGRAGHPRARRQAPRRAGRRLRGARRALLRDDAGAAHGAARGRAGERAAAHPPPLRPARGRPRRPRRLRPAPRRPTRVRPRGGADLHRVDVPGRGRPAGRRRARPRGVHGRAVPRPALVARPGAAVRDRRGAGPGRSAPGRTAVGARVPAAGAQPRRPAGGHARLLGLQQGRRDHDVAVGDPPGAAAAARHRRQARRAAAAVPRARRLGRARWRARGGGGAVGAVRHRRRDDEAHGAGRGRLRQVLATRPRPRQPGDPPGGGAGGDAGAPVVAHRRGHARPVGRRDERRQRRRAHGLPGAGRASGAAAVLLLGHARRRAG